MLLGALLLKVFGDSKKNGPSAPGPGDPGYTYPPYQPPYVPQTPVNPGPYPGTPGGPSVNPSNPWPTTPGFVPGQPQTPGQPAQGALRTYTVANDDMAYLVGERLAGRIKDDKGRFTWKAFTKTADNVAIDTSGEQPKPWQTGMVLLVPPGFTADLGTKYGANGKIGWQGQPSPQPGPQQPQPGPGPQIPQTPPGGWYDVNNPPFPGTFDPSKPPQPWKGPGAIPPGTAWNSMPWNRGTPGPTPPGTVSGYEEDPVLETDEPIDGEDGEPDTETGTV